MSLRGPGTASMVNLGGHKTIKPTFGHIVSFAAAYLLAAAFGQWLDVAPDNTATLWPRAPLRGAED